MGSSPPPLIRLKEWVKKFWGRVGGVVVRELNDSLFCFVFASEREAEYILKFNWSVHGKPLFLDKWHPLGGCSKTHRRLSSRWIRVMGLPLHLWGTEVFRAIENKCGGYLNIDELTQSGEEIRRARVLVKCNGNVPEMVHIKAGGWVFALPVCVESTVSCHFGELAVQKNTWKVNNSEGGIVMGTKAGITRPGPLLKRKGVNVGYNRGNKQYSALPKGGRALFDVGNKGISGSSGVVRAGSIPSGAGDLQVVDVACAVDKNSGRQVTGTLEDEGRCTGSVHTSARASGSVAGRVADKTKVGGILGGGDKAAESESLVTFSGCDGSGKQVTDFEMSHLMGVDSFGVNSSGKEFLSGSCSNLSGSHVLLPEGESRTNLVQVGGLVDVKSKDFCSPCLSV